MSLASIIHARGKSPFTNAGDKSQVTNNYIGDNKPSNASQDGGKQLATTSHAGNVDIIEKLKK